MKIILLGASGMVGKGALHEALADATVSEVLVVGRRSCGESHPKMQELLIPDLFDLAAHESRLSGYDACIWAVGVTSLGKDEAAYSKVTEELTMLWARTLLRLNPVFSFCYCSAMGAEGKSMWARVRQRVEAGIKALPFKHSGCVRPGFIRPGPGIRSATWLYQAGLTVFKPLLPLVMKAFPRYATTSERLGRAMLRVVQGRADKYILESADINRVGA
jgi:uncharacterized protein YbjT (DUF2867 family)